MSKRLYSKEHIWVYQDNVKVKIGISDYAQQKLKNIMFVNLPEVGDKVVLGERFGDIESIKTVSDLLSPVSGIVTRVNEDVLDDPSAVNESPYENWLLEIEISLISDELMDEEAYKNYV